MRDVRLVPRLLAISAVAAATVTTVAVTTGRPSSAAEITPPVATIPVGGSPLDIAVDTSTGLVYTANSHSGTVSVFNGRADLDSSGPSTVAVATVHVGSEPWAVAVNSRTDRVYVANHDSQSVSVIDGHDNKVIATIHNLVAPSGIGVVEASDRIYVSSDYGPKSLGRVDVIDGKTDRTISEVPVGIEPQSVGVNQVTQRVYVCNVAGNALSPNGYFVGTLTVVQGTSPIATVQVGLYNSPETVAVDQVHNRAYVTESSGDSSGVVVVDTSDDRAIDLIGTDQVQGVAVDPNLNRAYVAEGYQNGQGGLIYAIDTKVNEISEQVNMSNQPNNPSVQEAGNPWALAVDPTDGQLFVAYNETPGVVRAVDLGHYSLPVPAPISSTSVPYAPPTTAATTTTTAPKPTTTVASLGPPVKAGTWCWVFRKAGGNRLFSLDWPGPGTLESNGPLSGTTPCAYWGGSLRIWFGPSYAGAMPPTTPPNEKLPALGKGAAIWISNYITIWWPHKTSWLYIEALQTVPATLADVKKYLIPAEIEVAKSVNKVLGS